MAGKSQQGERSRLARARPHAQRRRLCWHEQTSNEWQAALPQPMHAPGCARRQGIIHTHTVRHPHAPASLLRSKPWKPLLAVMEPSTFRLTYSGVAPAGRAGGQAGVGGREGGAAHMPLQHGAGPAPIQLCMRAAEHPSSLSCWGCQAHTRGGVEQGDVAGVVHQVLNQAAAGAGHKHGARQVGGCKDGGLEVGTQGLVADLQTVVGS